MFTHKDIEFKTVCVINCIEKRNLRVSNGELLLEEKSNDKMVTLTKLPFQKILAIFVIGHITITTPLIDKCHKYNVSLIVVKPNLRPVFYWSNSAEANFLLRIKQIGFPLEDISIARAIVKNKVMNQLSLITKTRKKDERTLCAVSECKRSMFYIDEADDYKTLLGIEGNVAKCFFAAYFQDYGWKHRLPRTKSDVINTTLDIGYTILFNFVECFVRMFGFDVYIGVYHRLWFKRKSLICDLIEPFRCIIDHAVLLAFKRKQFLSSDFVLIKGEYHLKFDKTADYYKIFFNSLIEKKSDIFKYIQGYYRCFMGRKSSKAYPNFMI